MKQPDSSPVASSLIDLTGLSILITGGAGAIGRVMVRVLAEHGAQVRAVDIEPVDRIRAALASAGVVDEGVDSSQVDCTSETEVNAFFAELACTQQMPHVVCCHAGLVRPGPIETFGTKDFEETLDLNLGSAFLVSRAAVEQWLAMDMSGHLIYTTSWVQDVPWPEITAYTASKSALRTLMRGFARELASRGIRANAVAPGIVGVGMAKRQWDTDSSYQARAQKAIPLGEMQTPESVAHAFLFLCSPMASYMTGSVLLVDGGCSLYPMD
ncbi:MAG: SDR family NAD(P)-dependent oxidoreductase [Caldilineaceae bacterium]|nr:SDR family NAD(P)-dependent oxidoreductase [Caldilineaceae bacterium]